jgi:hypothetical protein
MPYKDEEAQREAARLRMQRMRAKGVTSGVTGDLTGPWLTVAEYINRPGAGPMSNLERLQRIAVMYLETRLDPTPDIPVEPGLSSPELMVETVVYYLAGKSGRLKCAA